MSRINTFYMLPKMLFKDKYEVLSLIAKVLYAILLERHNLSLKNNWRDSDGQIYIYYPVKDLSLILKISAPTVVSALKELEKFDLIERKKQGFGKPDRIKLYNVCEQSVFSDANKKEKYNSMATYNMSDLEKLINR